jgi:hypothetical protein
MLLLLRINHFLQPLWRQPHNSTPTRFPGAFSRHSQLFIRLISSITASLGERSPPEVPKD